MDPGLPGLEFETYGRIASSNGKLNKKTGGKPSKMTFLTSFSAKYHFVLFKQELSPTGCQAIVIPSNQLIVNATICRILN